MGINAVVYFNHGHINGCLFDAFEYYNAIFRKDKTKFFIISEHDKLDTLNNSIYFNDIIKIFKDRYVVKDNVYNHIIDVSHRKHMLTYSLKYKLNNVLFVDQFTPQIMCYIYAKQYFLIAEVYLETETNYFLINKDRNKKVFSEYLIYKKELLND